MGDGNCLELMPSLCNGADTSTSAGIVDDPPHAVKRIPQSTPSQLCLARGFR